MLTFNGMPLTAYCTASYPFCFILRSRPARGCKQTMPWPNDMHALYTFHGSCCFAAAGTSVSYSSTTGASLSINNTASVNLPAGSLTSNGTTVTLSALPASPEIMSLLPIAKAMYDLESHSTHLVQIVTPVQPSMPAAVVLYEGDGNPWVLSGGVAVDPTDELRVTYVNYWDDPATAPGEHRLSKLEVLMEREEVELTASVTANIPVWAFKKTAAGSYEARFVLSVSKNSCGSRRRLMSAAETSSEAASTVAEEYLTARSTASVLPPASHELLAGKVAAAAAAGCATNARPDLQCPAGWDPKISMAVPSATSISASHAFRRQRSKVHGVKVSRFGAMGAAAAASVGTSISSNETSSACAGSPLVRPVGVDATVVQSFGAKFVGSGWLFHPGESGACDTAMM